MLVGFAAESDIGLITKSILGKSVSVRDPTGATVNWRFGDYA
jgi:hypothetical protein